MPAPIANLFALPQPLLAADPLSTARTTGASEQGTGNFATLFQTAIQVLNRQLPGSTGTPLTGNPVRAGVLFDRVLGNTTPETQQDTLPQATDSEAAVVLGVAVPVVPGEVPPPTLTDAAAIAGLVNTPPVEPTTKQTSLAEPRVPSRVEQLRLQFPGGPAQAQRLTVAQVPIPNTTRVGFATGTPATVAQAPLLGGEITAAPLPSGSATQPAPIPGVIRAADFTGRFQTVLAQAPIVANLNPPLAVPPGGATLNPPTVGAVSALASFAAAPGVPDTQIGDRPAMAGERFAAIALAGARLVTTPPAATRFATVLEGTASLPVPATVPVALPRTGEVPARTPVAAAPLVAIAVPGASVTVERSAPIPPPGTPVTVERTTPTLTATSVPVTVPSASTPAPVRTAETLPIDVPVTRVVTPQPAITPTPTLEPRPAEATTLTTPPRVPDVAPRAVPGVPTAPVPTSDATAAVTVAPRSLPGETVTLPSPRVERSPDKAEVPTGFTVPTTTAPDPAPTRAAPVTPATPPTPGAQLADSIITHTRTLAPNGTVEFRMRLDPPDLGHVRVSLVSTGDDVRGQIVVADDTIRRMIEGQLPELRQRLEANGVNVQRFDVTTDPGAGGNRGSYREPLPSEDIPVPRPPPPPPVRPGAAPPGSGGLNILV